MTRDEFETTLKELQNVKVYTLESENSFLDRLFDYYDYKEVSTGLDVEKHRWYELSTIVLELGDWYLGVRGVTDIFSESTEYDDVGRYIEFFEMELIMKLTYIKKE